jgi:hypothetical protein
MIGNFGLDKINCPQNSGAKTVVSSGISGADAAGEKQEQVQKPLYVLSGIGIINTRTWSAQLLKTFET